MKGDIMEINVINNNKVIAFDNSLSILELLSGELKTFNGRAIAYKFNGQLRDIRDKVAESGEVEIITINAPEADEIVRHSTAHVMAEAVKRLFPNTKIAIGPAIENGFYYDFDAEKPFTDEDLIKITEEMNAIIAEDKPFTKEVVSKSDAKKQFQAEEEPYKLELIESIQDANVSIFRQGGFNDLCRGPHVPTTKFLGHFKLKSVAGAYWRGDSKNKMLQRIYGFAFASKKELAAHLKFLEEAEKRDHRRLGKELNIFTMSEYAPGCPIFLPNGMIIKNTLLDLWRKEHTKAGYIEVQTPIIMNRTLWETSGHWFNYKENMYTTKVDEEDFAIKPMNCPGGMLVYKEGLHSYRELPIRMGELGNVHRHEFSGALHGLMRVRNFTQDDAHIFMTEDQIEQEIVGVINLIDKFYSQIFGFEYSIFLSTKPEKAIGSDEIWEKATAGLKAALDHKGLKYTINEGDGAFYGPKIDFVIKDCIGRTWQCGTIQLDLNLPERFDLNYIGADGEKHRPIMIHRVVYGSIERFIGILIEHYAGLFPLWLAPVQINVSTVSEEQHPYAEEVIAFLESQGLRVKADLRNEKLGLKIRESNMSKTPIQIILGKSEMDEKKLTVRRHGSQANSTMSFDEFMASIQEELKAVK